MNFSNLNLSTLAKGLVVVFLSGVVGVVGASIIAGHLPALPEWIAAAKVAGLGAIAYLLKAIFSKPEDNYSKFFALNWRDIAKAVLMLFISTVFASITAMIQDGHFPTGAELLTAAGSGLTVAIAYIIKNVFTNSDGTVLKKE